MIRLLAILTITLSMHPFALSDRSFTRSRAHGMVETCLVFTPFWITVELLLGSHFRLTFLTSPWRMSNLIWQVHET